VGAAVAGPDTKVAGRLSPELADCRLVSSEIPKSNLEKKAKEKLRVRKKLMNAIYEKKS